jgi:HK97 family phage portal protein
VIVQTLSGLKTLAAANPRPIYYQGGQSAIPLSSGYAETPAQIYATQPNVRTCIDFLARNVAMLGLDVYRRVSDTDREHLNDHQLQQWLDNPNPATTRYRLIEDLIADLGVYFNAYWLKVREPDRIRLIRLPPQQMLVRGGLLPDAFVYQSWRGEAFEFPTSEIVYFRGYNPVSIEGGSSAMSPLMGLSQLETLAHVLGEEAAAADHREFYWRNATRQEGIIERPKDAPRWTKEQKQDWRRQWQERYSGPQGAGLVAVLEDGMTWKPTSWSMKDSEYLSTRKQAREECASSWHIPLPMVGILDHATYSNIREQHKQLYSDTLGPTLEMVTQEIEKQLLVECKDTKGIYVEFNIAAKLQGSFEEQATAFRMYVGRPIMTANEARARLNLPRITDDPSADQLAAQQGGPALPPTAALEERDPAEPTVPPVPDDGAAVQQQRIAAVVRAAWVHQAGRLGKVPREQRAEALDAERCTRELATGLLGILPWPVGFAFAARVTDDTYTRLLEGRDPFTPDREVPTCATT